MELIFDIIASITAASLCGMGVGGGGLLVIWLTLVRGLEQHMSQSLNLLFFIAAAASSMVIHLQNRSLDLRVTCKLALPALIGTMAGSIIAMNLSAPLLRRIFGGLLVLSGIRTMRKREESE